MILNIYNVYREDPLRYVVPLASLRIYRLSILPLPFCTKSMESGPFYQRSGVQRSDRFGRELDGVEQKSMPSPYRDLDRITLPLDYVEPVEG